MKIVKAIAAAIAAVPLFAASLWLSPAAEASPCMTAAYSAYTASGFSCSVGGVTFSNIGVDQNTIGAAYVKLGNISPTTFIYNGHTEYGLTLTYDAAAVIAGSADIAWTYNVSGNLLSDVYLSVNGATKGDHGVHDTIVKEVLSNGNYLTVDDSNPVNYAQILPPEASLYVVKDDNTFALGGYAFSSAVTNAWSLTPAPEPTSLALLGTACIGLGFFRTRRKSA